MNIPGAPDTIEAGARHVLDVLEQNEVRRNPRYRAKQWQDLDAGSQALLMRAFAAGAEVVAVAMIAHQRAIMRQYGDEAGMLGAMIDQALVRYSHQELHYDPPSPAPQLHPLTRGYHHR